MSKILSDEQIKNIKSNQNVVFATSDKNNQPRCVVVIPSRVEEDRIILSSIQMNKTLENLKQNPKCFINVYVSEQDDLQYKIEGYAEIYESGSLFEEIKGFEESENLPPDLSVHSIVVVKIISVEESMG